MATRPKLEPFDGAMATVKHRCECCEERDAVGYWDDAYSCQECYDEAEAPYREVERLRSALLDVARDAWAAYYYDTPEEV